MKLQDIEQEALGLSEKERADLVLSLMRTLAAPGADITDDEVFRLDAELEDASVEPMLHEEFLRRVCAHAGQRQRSPAGNPGQEPARQLHSGTPSNLKNNMQGRGLTQA